MKLVNPKRCRHCHKILQPNMYGHYEIFCSYQCRNGWATNLKKLADNECRRATITKNNKRRCKAKVKARARRNRKSNRRRR